VYIKQTFNETGDRLLCLKVVVGVFVGTAAVGATISLYVWQLAHPVARIPRDCANSAAAVHRKPAASSGISRANEDLTGGLDPSNGTDLGGRSPLLLAMPSPVSARRPPLSGTSEAEIADTAVAFDKLPLSSLSEEPKLLPPMPSLNKAHQGQRFAGDSITLSDTAVAATNAAMPVKAFNGVVPKPRETSLFGDSDCASPPSCPFARDWRNSDCSASNSRLLIMRRPPAGYTKAAEELGIRGDVELDVVFGADGEVHVKRLLKGLGYGLDELAAASATRTTFRPAVEERCPVNTERTLIIPFGGI
jgi:hypothetical protein